MFPLLLLCLYLSPTLSFYISRSLTLSPSMYLFLSLCLCLSPALILSMYVILTLSLTLCFSMFLFLTLCWYLFPSGSFFFLLSLGQTPSVFDNIAVSLSHHIFGSLYHTAFLSLHIFFIPLLFNILSLLHTLPLYSIPLCCLSMSLSHY